MGKFWKTDEEKVRFFKYFQAFHKKAGRELLDKDMDKFFETVSDVHENAKELKAEIDKHNEILKKYPREKNDLILNNSIGRIFPQMLKVEKTDADREYNKKLIERCNTEDGVKDIIKEAYDILMKIDINIVNAPLEKRIIYQKDNINLFGLANIPNDVILAYQHAFPENLDEAKKLADIKTQLETAMESTMTLDFFANDLYPYMPEKMDYIGAMDAVAKGKIDGVKIENGDGAKLTDFFAKGIAYAANTNAFDLDAEAKKMAEERKARERAEVQNEIDEIFKLDYADFRKQYDSDKDMYDDLKQFAKDVSKLAINKKDASSQEDIKLAEFAELVKNIPQKAADGKTFPGRKLYVELKRAFINAGIRADINIISVEDNKNVKDPLRNMADNSQFLDEMITLLEKGDKWYRGSSDAYKDIQNHLHYLKDSIARMNKKGKLNEVESRKFIEVNTKAILDKACTYVEDRKKSAINYSADSYKGKRIDNMSKVINRLNLRINSWKKQPLVSENDAVIDSQKLNPMLSDALKNTNFNPRLFGQMLKGAGENLNEATLGILKNYYRDRKADIKEACKYYTEISAELNKCASNDIKKLKQMKTSLESAIKANSPGKIIMDNLDMLDLKNYEGRITGDRELDVEVAKVMLEKVENKLEPTAANKNKHSEPGMAEPMK